jgi:hypothetical protein
MHIYMAMEHRIIKEVSLISVILVTNKCLPKLVTIKMVS